MEARGVARIPPLRGTLLPEQEKGLQSHTLPSPKLGEGPGVRAVERQCLKEFRFRVRTKNRAWGTFSDISTFRCEAHHHTQIFGHALRRKQIGGQAHVAFVDCEWRVW